MVAVIWNDSQTIGLMQRRLYTICISTYIHTLCTAVLFVYLRWVSSYTHSLNAALAVVEISL